MAQPRIMPYLVTLLLLLSLPFTFIPLASGYMQSVGVRGELGCPYRNEFTMQIVIELWDRNQFRMDSNLARVIPNQEGFFDIQGTADAWGTMNPYLRIRHNCCPYECPPSQEVLLEVPQQFVTSGPYPLYWFEAGPIELANSGGGYNNNNGRWYRQPY